MKLLDKLKNYKRENLQIEIVEPVDERRQELATVQVKDIKEYLLEEYERSQQLYDQNQELRKKLLEVEEVKIKYDATLVTLDEYQERLKKYEKKCLDYENELQKRRQETEEVRDELNNYKIKFQRASITKDEIKMEVVHEVKEKIINAITQNKGNLSKKKVVDIIRGI